MRHIFPQAVSVTRVTTSITRPKYACSVSMPFRPPTPTRLQAKGWARVGKPGAHLLRRGAWYPVVRVSSSHIVVLDVNRRSEEHTSELQSPCNLVCRLLLEKKKRCNQ